MKRSAEAAIVLSISCPLFRNKQVLCFWTKERTVLSIGKPQVASVFFAVGLLARNQHTYGRPQQKSVVLTAWLAAMLLWEMFLLFCRQCSLGLCRHKYSIVNTVHIKWSHNLRCIDVAQNRNFHEMTRKWQVNWKEIARYLSVFSLQQNLFSISSLRCPVIMVTTECLIGDGLWPYALLVCHHVNSCVLIQRLNKETMEWDSCIKGMMEREKVDKG
jgi:hypothetical protein